MESMVADKTCLNLKTICTHVEYVSVHFLFFWHAHPFYISAEHIFCFKIYLLN